MNYSNGRPNPFGRFSSPNARQTEQDIHRADEAAAAARDEHSPARIREEYQRAVAPTTVRVQPAGYGQGLTDRQAFDRAIADHGYVRAVTALKTVSAQAKARDDAYWAKRGRR